MDTSPFEIAVRSAYGCTAWPDSKAASAHDPAILRKLLVPTNPAEPFSRPWPGRPACHRPVASDSSSSSGCQIKRYTRCGYENQQTLSATAELLNICLKLHAPLFLGVPGRPELSRPSNSAQRAQEALALLRRAHSAVSDEDFDLVSVSCVPLTLL